MAQDRHVSSENNASLAIGQEGSTPVGEKAKFYFAVVAVLLIPVLPYVWARYEVPGLHVLHAVNVMLCIVAALTWTATSLLRHKHFVRAISFSIAVVIALTVISPANWMGRRHRFEAIAPHLEHCVNALSAAVREGQVVFPVPEECSDYVLGISGMRRQDGNFELSFKTYVTFPMKSKGYIYVSDDVDETLSRLQIDGPKIVQLNEHWLAYSF